jgi:GntR family transcriptional regulator
VPDRFEPGPRTINERDTPGRALVVSVAAELAAPPPIVAEHLGDELAVVRRRVFAVDGRPVQLAESWIPRDIAPERLLEADTGPGGMWARLAEVGHGPTGPAVERWRVRPATDDERDALELPPGSRVLEGFRVVYDAHRRPVDATVMVLAESAYVLDFRFEL